MDGTTRRLRYRRDGGQGGHGHRPELPFYARSPERVADRTAPDDVRNAVEAGGTGRGRPGLLTAIIGCPVLRVRSAPRSALEGRQQGGGNVSTAHQGSWLPAPAPADRSGCSGWPHGHGAHDREHDPRADGHFMTVGNAASHTVEGAPSNVSTGGGEWCQLRLGAGGDSREEAVRGACGLTVVEHVGGHSGGTATTRGGGQRRPG